MCSCPCSGLACWFWLVPTSASGCASSARDSFPPRCWGLGGRVPALQPPGSHLLSPIPIARPGEAPAQSTGPNVHPTSPGLPVGIGCPLPPWGVEEKGGQGVPPARWFWVHLAPAAIPFPRLSVTAAWRVLVLHVWRLWLLLAQGWERTWGTVVTKGPWQAEGAWQPLAPTGPYRGKVTVGLDTQRGFGTGQQELLCWEVTVVAALCPMSCLATCFPLGDGTLGWRTEQLGTEAGGDSCCPQGCQGQAAWGDMWQGPCPGTGDDIGTAHQGSQAPPGSVRGQSQDPIP